MQIKYNWKDRFVHWLGGFGIDVFSFRRGVKGFLYVLQDYKKFQSQHASQEEFPISFSYPCPGDRFEEAGVASGHYFHQDLLVAQKIFERRPRRHVDVGSRIDGFVAHVAAFRDIEVLDIRPIRNKINNVVFHQFDLLGDANAFEAYCDSLSCLHTLEHLGLGRYGDRIMVDGYLNGFRKLWSILKPGGILYLSVPIGLQRIEFNAHRVFSIKTILDMAQDWYDVEDFSYVDDLGNLHKSAPLTQSTIHSSFDCWYGCGIFDFRKR